MELNLGGKRAIVTGASRGIGRAFVMRLVDEGARVCALARPSEALDTLAGYGPPGSVTPVAVDLAAQSARDTAVSLVLAEMGGVDLVVSNVGDAPTGRLDNVDSEQFRRAWDLKLVFATELCRRTSAGMRERRSGSILLISGVAAEKPAPGYIVGSPVNAAVVSFGKSLALDLARYNVRVNVISPGAVFTERLQKLARQLAERRGVTLEEATKTLISRTPLGRGAAPEEIADVGLFVLSDRANFMTGSHILVDGGASCQ